MANGLKAQIIVQAGMFPGEIMPRFTRIWNLSSEIVEACERDPNDYRYMDAMGTAMNYAANLQNPNKVNWVRVEWIWM